MRELYADEHLEAFAQLSLRPNGFWKIEKLFVPVPFRGQGVARELMKRILEDADREGVYLSIWLEDPRGMMSINQLEKWFKRMGFRGGTYPRLLLTRVPRGKRADILLNTTGRPSRSRLH